MHRARGVRAIADGISSMRGKLSHPLRPLSRPGPAFDPPSFPVTGILAGLLFATLLGCEIGGPADREDTAVAEPAAFDWPADPTHPVLELSIASPDTSGRIQIELMPELAPETVARIVSLAEDGYYDGTTFHRVIPGFMIQGGDPNTRDRNPDNDGMGGFDEAIPDEFGEAPFLRGVVGMGNRGIEGSTSAQFFIMHADNRSLDGRYNAVGRVLDGLPVLDRITHASIDRLGRWGPKDRPIENVVIERARIVGEVAAVRAAMELERMAGRRDPSPTQSTARFSAKSPDGDQPTSNAGRPASPDGEPGAPETPAPPPASPSS